MPFNNKTVVIIGGASGIGRATALAAGREGAQVVVADLDEKGAAEVAAAIHDQGGKAIAVAADATKAKEVQNIATEAVKAYGGIHYLCCSAGLQTYGTVESTSEDTWEETMAVNLKSAFLAAKYCIPEIRRQGGGAVVNISSVQGLRCQKNVTAYAASKGAVIAMTRSMALDYARENIRVNCICPGSVDTPMLRYGAAKHGEPDEVLKEWGESHPIGRVGKPEEIAETVLFLFSEQSGFMLGQAVVVDGGLISQIL